MQQKINTKKAPEPIGPYEQAVLINGTLYTSGQIAINAESGDLVTENIEAETRQVMENLQAVLAAANLGFNHVVKATIYTTDLALFGKINEVYGSFFKEGKYPTRETVQVAALPKGVNVEISLVAVV